MLLSLEGSLVISDCVSVEELALGVISDLVSEELISLEGPLVILLALGIISDRVSEELLSLEGLLVISDWEELLALGVISKWVSEELLAHDEVSLVVISKMQLELMVSSKHTRLALEVMSSDSKSLFRGRPTTSGKWRGFPDKRQCLFTSLIEYNELIHIQDWLYSVDFWPYL